jgi:hypothetical protein
MTGAMASPAKTSSHLAPGGSRLTVPAWARIMSKMAARTWSRGTSRCQQGHRPLSASTELHTHHSITVKAISLGMQPAG